MVADRWHMFYIFIRPIISKNICRKFLNFTNSYCFTGVILDMFIQFWGISKREKVRMNKTPTLVMIIFIVKITQHKRGGKLNISSIIRICNFHTVSRWENNSRKSKNNYKKSFKFYLKIKFFNTLLKIFLIWGTFKNIIFNMVLKTPEALNVAKEIRLNQ